MYLVLKELADRAIEFIVPRVKGETYEEKIRVLLRWTIFYATIVTWLAVGLGLQYSNAIVRKKEWEETSAVIQQIFAVEDNPLKSFIDINRGLNERLDSLHQDHVDVLKSRAECTMQNEQLMFQNLQLKRLVENSKQVPTK